MMLTESFNQWLAKRYPKISQSLKEDDLGGNEHWLYTAVKEAYTEGYAKGAADARPEGVTEHGLDW